MKKSESQLQAALAESLQASLSGLSEKHAKKLQKTVARTTRKLAHKFAKLVAKERKAGKTTVPPVLRKAARRVGKRAHRPATPKKALATASS
jgi:hypothetical protein